MNISFLAEKLPYSQSSGTKVGTTYKKRRLRHRSRLEVHKFSKVERGMKQLQFLLDFYDTQSETSMMPFFWASNICTRWELRRQLCNSYVKLGLIQSALDEYMGMFFFVF